MRAHLHHLVLQRELWLEVCGGAAAELCRGTVEDKYYRMCRYRFRPPRAAHDDSGQHLERERGRRRTMFAARAMSKAAAPARAAASRAAVAAPKRGMAGGAAPKYTGWEAKVREKLPKDEHVS